MKKFVKSILTTLLITIILAFFVDWGIDLFFRKYHKRFKVDVENQHAQVVFFGSSRCIHSIIPLDFQKYTGLSAYNMGWSGSNPREIYAAVKIYLSKNYKPNYILIQLDLESLDEESDYIAQVNLFKFYKQGIIDEYFNPEIKKELNVRKPPTNTILSI